MENIQLNERILRFAYPLGLYFVDCVGSAGIKYYKVFTYFDVEVGKIDIDCSYEQFLEQVVTVAMSELEKALLC